MAKFRKIFAVLITLTMLLGSISSAATPAFAADIGSFEFGITAGRIIDGEVTVSIFVPACKLSCLVLQLDFDTAVVEPVSSGVDEDGNTKYAVELSSGINGTVSSGLNIADSSRLMLGFIASSSVSFTKTTQLYTITFKVDDSMTTQTPLTLRVNEMVTSTDGTYTEFVSVTGEASASCTIDRIPKIGGSVTISDTTPAVGQILTANTSKITPNDTLLSYQWYRGDSPITGATQESYTVSADDYNQKLKVVVSSAQPDCAGSKESALTSAVSAAALGGTVTISGELEKGKTLTAQTDGITPAGVTDFTYQWYRGSTKISGATSKTYVPVKGDVGKILKVTVGSSHSCYTGTVTGKAGSAILGDKKIASTTYTVADGLVKGVASGTTVSQLLSRLTPVSGIKVYGTNGKELSSGDVVGTGCTLKLVSGLSVVDTATVVVKGDLDGDGSVAASDARLALRCATSLESLSAAQLAAGAISGGAKPTASDARTILRVATKLETF
ncbi:MAG: hypothetical protein GX051_08065 [Clostridiales bacterium]|nr:hypothetical protein [Clostridiales bacterium]